jgi:predicted outer membrane repeat protein
MKRKLNNVVAGLLGVTMLISCATPAFAASYVDNEVYFETGKLQNALDLAAEWNSLDDKTHEVSLATDETDNVIIISDVTLNLNGYTLEGKEDGGSVITIESNLNDVTITDGIIIGGNGNTIGSNQDLTYGGGIFISKDSDVVIDEVTFTDNNATSQGGAIYLTNGSSITVTNSQFSDNTAGQSGGAIHAQDGDIIVSNSVLTDNDGGVLGGAISNKAGETIITNSELSGNSVEGNGGAVYAEGGDITIVDCVLTGNSAGLNGGAVYGTNMLEDSSDVTIEGSTLTENKAGAQGGAIYNVGGSVEIIDSQITDNEANEGGGVAVIGYYQDQVVDMTFTFDDDWNLIPITTIIQDEIDKDASLTIKNSSVINNAATTAGDDIYAEKAYLNLGEVSGTLDSDGEDITGWYEDGGPRWSAEDNFTIVDEEMYIETAVAIKAAHDKIPMKETVPTDTEVNADNEEEIIQEEDCPLVDIPDDDFTLIVLPDNSEDKEVIEIIDENTPTEQLPTETITASSIPQTGDDLPFALSLALLCLFLLIAGIIVFLI